jgi:type IV pilus assembly protein PilC
MPRFRYSAVDKSGSLVRGSLEGSTPESVEKELRKQGLYPISVKREAKRINLFKRRVKKRDLLSFTIQFYSVVTSGISLLRGFEDISKQVKNPRFREILEDIKGRLSEGQSMHTALSQYPDVFPAYYRGAIRTGEETGNLGKILEDLIILLEKQEEIEAQIKQATTYPAVALLALSGVGIFYIFVVLPKVLSLISQLAVSLPLPTKFLLFFTHFAKSFWFVPLLFVILLITLFFFLKRTPRGKYLIDKIKLKIPVFGPIYEKALLARFSSHFAMLLRSGVDMVTSFELLEEVIGNKVMEEKLREAKEKVKTGASLISSLREFPMSPLVFSMIAVGEETGRLEEELAKAAEYHEKDVDRSTRRALVLIEPALLIFFGIFAAFVFLSVLLPIYDAVARIR